MIHKNVQKYFCCEDISLIENYDKAVSSPEKWECHHRLETDLGLTKQELIDTNRYYNVEAKYLIFLSEFEHKSLHFKGKDFNKGRTPWNKGKTGMKYKNQHKKYKWMTPNGEIVEMVKNLAKRHHPYWKLLE